MIDPTAPIVVGGVGGSGTRLVSRLLAAAGCFMGSDLNPASDNLAYSYLFVRPDILDAPDNELTKRLNLFADSMMGRSLSDGDIAELKLLAMQPVDHGPMKSPIWLAERAERLCRTACDPRKLDQFTQWGWKEPNSHVLLDALIEAFPRVRYVLVIRNGLDMAFSANQNQVRLWGRRLFGIDVPPVTPRSSLEYWVRANKRANAIGAKLSDRYKILHFETLCEQPGETIRDLCEFAGLDCQAERIAELAADIDPPASIGRFRQFDCSSLGHDDVRAVAEMGFPVT